MPRSQSPLGLPSWLRDLPLWAFHLHRARGLFSTSGRLGFSPDWPGSPLLGSCGPGREKTPFSHALPATASIPVGCFLTFNAVILDSQRPREALGKTRTPKALPAPWALGPGRPGGLAGDNRPQLPPLFPRRSSAPPRAHLQHVWNPGQESR